MIFSLVESVLLMYNTTGKVIDKLQFVDTAGSALSTLTLKTPISIAYRTPLPFNVKQYQMAAVFTGDLDFLANFLGHQGASATWLCMFCLANQEKVGDKFALGDDAPRFPKRRGIHSI